MLAKVSAIIVTVGVVGCVLLTTRQLRLQAVHDLAVLQRRVSEHDRNLWRLRIAIASSVMPRNVEQLAKALGPLEPIPVGPTPARPGAGPTMQVATTASVPGPHSTLRQDRPH